MSSPEVTVRRPVYQQDELHRVCDYTKPKRQMSHSVTKKVRRWNVMSFLKQSLPLLVWLPKYDWKNDIIGDIVAGITVAIMHIPQGMAYAILGNVPPVVGIYMAFFPVIVYLILGTSRHNSMGSFALICMMTGKTVLVYSTPNNPMTNGTSLESAGVIPSESHLYSATDVATAITFSVAIIQLGMYVLRLGVISSLLSDTLISGFTSAAAIHVLTSQMKDLFGLKIPKRKGIFKVVMTYVDIFNNIDNINVAATVLSSITIVAMVFNNEVLKLHVAKKCALPIPIEMLAVVIGTIVSTQMNLTEAFDIVTVGHIPVGLPVPSLPPLSLISDVLLDSFVITMVSYTISMSMALIFAQKMDYEVDANQELLAQGAGNLLGSFFSCMPFCASLSRSLIQQTVGGRSQLASAISCILLLCVLLWVGPFFEPLPRCILASIIVVSLKGMLLQVTQFLRFWRLSRLDAAVWIITFLIVVLLDIEYGLLAGIALSLTSLLVLAMHPYTCELALVPGTELYLDVKRYKGTVGVPGIKMLHYGGGLNFASRISFRNEVYKVSGMVPQKELARRLKMASRKDSSETKVEGGYVNGAFEGDLGSDHQQSYLYAIILDFSSLVYIDPSGVVTLRTLVDDYQKIGVSIYLAGCSGPVFDTMRKCNMAQVKEGHFTMFPTVGDAVNFAIHLKNPPSPTLPTICLPDDGEGCSSRL